MSNWGKATITISLVVLFVTAVGLYACKKKDTTTYAEIKPASAIILPEEEYVEYKLRENGGGGIGTDLRHYDEVDLKKPLDKAALDNLDFVGDPKSPEAQGPKRVVIKTPLVAFKVCSTTDDKYEYIVSEIPLQIQVPVGRIRHFQLTVSLKADGRACDKAVVRDGFPKDLIEENYIVEGKVTCGVDLDTSKFIPPPLPVEAKLGVEIKLIEFKIGAARNVKVDFSGPGNTYASWYLNKDGVQNDLTVFLITRREKDVEEVTADVEAMWEYKGPGFLKPVQTKSDSSSIRIYPE